MSVNKDLTFMMHRTIYSEDSGSIIIRQ